MSTWHQDQALRRHYEAQREARKPLTSPYQHATQWTVVYDPPNGMTSVSRHGSKLEAYEQAAKFPHTYTIAPKEQV